MPITGDCTQQNIRPTKCQIEVSKESQNIGKQLVIKIIIIHQRFKFHYSDRAMQTMSTTIFLSVRYIFM